MVKISRIASRPYRTNKMPFMMISALRMNVSHTRKYTDMKILPIVKKRLDPKGSSSSAKFPIVPVKKKN